MITQITAPGKMILLGEYAVLDGAPALVAAINRRAQVQLTNSTVASPNSVVEAHPPGSRRVANHIQAPAILVNDAPFYIQPSGYLQYDQSVTPLDKKRLKYVTAIIKTTAHFLQSRNFSITPFRLRLDTSAFYDAAKGRKFGLGSSAALTSAVCAGLFALADWPDAPEKSALTIFNLSRNAHHRAQGKIGSGIDIAASVYGGVFKYEIDACQKRSPQQMDIPDHFHLLPIWSGQSASTVKMVNMVQVMKAERPEEYHAMIRDLSAIATAGCQAFQDGRLSAFLEAIRLYYQMMLKLGEASGAPIISPAHQQLAEIVARCGGVYKPSGAGGGDLGIAFAPDAEVLDQIKIAINANGFAPLDLTIDPAGVCVTTLDANDI